MRDPVTLSFFRVVMDYDDKWAKAKSKISQSLFRKKACYHLCKLNDKVELWLEILHSNAYYGNCNISRFRNADILRNSRRR